ncbi:DUF1799 domain-containing protein [Xanthomonas perforans]
MPGNHPGLLPRPPGGPGKKLRAAVGAFYWRPPAAEELAQFGLTEDDVDRPSVDLWPEVWDAWCVFCDCCTQWRMGAAGPIGLDYLVVYRELDRRGTNSDVDMDAVRVLESAALDYILKSKPK